MKVPPGVITLIADGRLIFQGIKLIITLFTKLKTKNMWAKIKLFIHQLITKIEGDFEGYITKDLVPTIKVLNEVKKAIDNPVVDWAATLAGIPGFAAIKTFLDTAIPEAVIALGVIQTTLTPKVDAEGKPVELTTADYLNALVTWLQAQSPLVQTSTLMGIAGFIVKLSHGALTEDQATLVVNATVVKMKEEAATVTVATIAPTI